MNIKPFGNKILVKPDTAAETTPGGIVLADNAREAPQEGTVVAVGEGRTLESGEKVAIGVREGDTVIYAKYGGIEIKHEGAKYLILDESSILAVKQGTVKGAAE